LFLYGMLGVGAMTALALAYYCASSTNEAFDFD
jgi:hypothetical protein